MPTLVTSCLHDVTKVGDFYNGGSMGKILIFCRIKLKFGSWLYKKRWQISCKFQLEITSNKKVFVKKPLTNLYEMNSSFTSLGSNIEVVVVAVLCLIEDVINDSLVLIEWNFLWKFWHILILSVSHCITPLANFIWDTHILVLL